MTKTQFSCIVQARSQGIIKGGYILGGLGELPEKKFKFKVAKPQNLMISTIAKEISDVQISFVHDGNARPASSIPRDGLQCTEHVKYMGTICGGTVDC